MAPDSLNTVGSEIAVNGRRYRLPQQPVVVVCIDGSEPGYIERAVEAAAGVTGLRARRESQREAVRERLCDAASQARDFANALRGLRESIRGIDTAR